MKKIEEIKALPNYQLRINFLDGSQKLYSLYNLIMNDDYYSILKNEVSRFKKVKIDETGEGITWGDELDLTLEELYEYEI